VFKYLGCLLACNNNDTQVMRSNLKKAQKCWARISHVLRAENVASQVCKVFYKATVMSVLLFGSETWSLAPGTLKRLDGFPTHYGDGYWTYLCNAQALKKVGLYSISHYNAVRRKTISSLSTLSIGPFLSFVEME
jgi:hypothetical protein